MSTEDSATVRRIAFCSALCAGFAYVSYNVISKVFFSKPSSEQQIKANDILHPLQSSKSVQTEAPIPTGEYFNINKTVRERVKDLNVMSQQFRRSNIPLPVSPVTNMRPGSPNLFWSSPLGCAKYLSFSAENISCSSPLPSPENKRRSRFSVSVSGKSSECLSSLKESPSDSKENIKNDFPQDYAITMKTLYSLQKVPRKMTLFETRSILGLLQSDNEDILVKTLSTISNCAAFSSNQEQLCRAGCSEVLFELLQHPSEAVKVASAQAISNIAVLEKGYLYFQPHVPILQSYSQSGGELLKSISLTALANLALNNAGHKMLIGNVSSAFQLVEEGNDVVRLQALRLLVNLSCNRDMIPYLLLSKVSSRFFDSIISQTNREITLRFMTFLANVITCAVQDLKITSRKSTLLSLVYKMEQRSDFNCISKLVHDTDEDLSYQAKRLCVALQQKSQSETDIF